MSTDNLSNNNAPTTNQLDTKKSHNLRKRLLMLLTTASFLLLFIGYGAYWLLVLRYQVYTDDAYVKGLQIPIVAQVRGNVTKVFFENTNIVHAGDIVVELDDTDAKLAYENAKHQLAEAVRKIQTIYQENIGYEAAIEEQKISLARAERDYQRRSILGSNGAVSQETLQHAKETMEIAKSALAVAKQKLKSNQALLLNTELAKQPSILVAADNVRNAWVNLQRTVIRAPMDGYVARRSVQVGSQVDSTTPLMVIVPTNPMWVDANFKETQLNNIRIGQPVKITSDFYGDDIVFQGTVEGINMGTGSAFSLLPAQNATGNWIKIVQRLPVRIRLDNEQSKKYPLMIGLSMNVTIDIEDTNGKRLQVKQRTTPAFQSNATVVNVSQANHIINNIIQENTTEIN
ncbi:EmrA/EmrK family multidrug efflux transporter periplasmic adaptor subunit [Entomomonas moraniae]|uniref:EmrA/EmrK family multidrug efflux transporter periplasmic adaptor subunit n=1 Tax=Entomomonas moraniae TaxID=2213226 RepID=A0A3Q9JM21_9GAMM|nr:EmrA/EmrK family multidrug efflux transporter periplasmic adaptor subunit [Entomomonas moraniae]AZS50265.1 EmrA/EmrK family multidrug efflux transporter periplasmic adaptor subunit [Entomomonas moraniae]